jgi:acetate kinase
VPSTASRGYRGSPVTTTSARSPRDAPGDEAARLAFDHHAHRIRKYVGAYAAVLGAVDAVVFTAVVGQHSPELRAASLAGLELLGIEIDHARNAGPLDGSRDASRVQVLVMPTNDEWEIARQAWPGSGKTRD